MAQDIVGSAMKAQNGYGQNGYGGPSSDEPGTTTKIDNLNLPTCDLAQATKDTVGGSDGAYAGGLNGKGNGARPAKQPPVLGPQTRDVGVSKCPLAFGMDQRSPRNR